MNTELTKHWHYLIVLLILFAIDVFVSNNFSLAPRFISLAMLGVGMIVVVVAWISFGINKKKVSQKEREFSQASVPTLVIPNISNSDSESKDVLFHKYTYKYCFLFVGAVFLVITMLQKQGLTLADLRNGAGGHPIFRLSKDYLQFFAIYIFCVSLYFAFLKYKKSNLDIAFLFVVIGVIFNPFFPFHFGNNLQNIVNLLAILFFVYIGYREHENNMVDTKKY